MSSRAVNSLVGKRELLRRKMLQRCEVKTNMNISRFVLGACVLCALPALAQPEQKPVNGLPYPFVSHEEAARSGRANDPIVLRMRDVTLREALEEVERQTGVPIETEDESLVGSSYWNQRLSLSLNTPSFWKATDAVFKAAKVKLVLQKDAVEREWWASGVSQEGDRPNDLPSSGSIAFPWRVLSLKTWYHKTVVPGRKRRNFLERRLTVNLEARVDPRTVVMGEPQIKIARADDERGRPFTLTQSTHYLTSSNSFLYHAVEFDPFSMPRKRLAHLAGTGTFLLGLKRKTWEVPDVVIAKKITVEIETAAVPIYISVNVFRNTDGILVRFELKSRSPVKVENHPEWDNPLLSPQFISFMRALDAKGQPVKSSVGSISNIPSGYRFDCHFTTTQGNASLPPQPLKLFFDIPTEFVQTEVPFSFSDVPLP